jgi:hypothetical protein
MLPWHARNTLKSTGSFELFQTCSCWHRKRIHRYGDISGKCDSTGPGSGPLIRDAEPEMKMSLANDCREKHFDVLRASAKVRRWMVAMATILVWQMQIPMSSRAFWLR